MLTPLPLIRQRLLHTRQPWPLHSTRHIRWKSSKPQRRPRFKTISVKSDEQDVPQKDDKKPSLIEQLFPEETKRYEEAQRKASRESEREIPRLPLDTVARPPKIRVLRPAEAVDDTRSDAAQQLERHMRTSDASQTEITVLVLRNASPNLVEEDFRRLIPQGKHMEGWTLEQGDILKVIPGRNLSTLEQENYYYILFESKLSAFTYQGHATRIAQLAAANTPGSMMSMLPLSKGMMVDGFDAQSAIASFALVPPSQTMDLRQLQPPLSPLMTSIVRNRGYAAVEKRRDPAMPFEVRLTMEGPQILAPAIRHTLLTTAKERALGWSGGEEMAPRITKWEPQNNVSPMDNMKSLASRSIAAANERDAALSPEELEELENEKERKRAVDVGTARKQEMQRRTPGVVYIVSFYTEMAARQFVAYWHRREMIVDREKEREDFEDDLPPIACAEMLCMSELDGAVVADLRTGTVGAVDIVDVDSAGDVILVCSAGSGGEKRLRVSSAALGLGSPVFKAMLSVRFREGHELALNFRIDVPLPDDDGEAMNILCNVLHHRNKAVLDNWPQTDMMVKVAILSDKYDCIEAMMPTAKCWLPPPTKTGNLTSRRNLMTAAYYFHDNKAFATYGRWLIYDFIPDREQCAVWHPAKNDDDHPLRQVFALLESERQGILSKATDFIEEQVGDRLRGSYSPQPCTKDCTFKLQFSARFINRLQEAKLWPRHHITGSSVTKTIERMQTMNDDGIAGACSPCAGLGSSACAWEEAKGECKAHAMFEVEALAIWSQAEIPCVLCFREGKVKMSGCDHGKAR
ncbi:hypothetical protein LTR15_008306 [Elasticomyces elasticus]|nr:hypothetical protein LTR15_008306 [Elasticomyces elasticus]